MRQGIGFVVSAGLAFAVTAGCGGDRSDSSGANPLTGTGSRPSGPVVGVKIDDTARARPQAGLDAADVVYVEPAEGGLTRLLAVYASHRPNRIGPVRSVRGHDPELLAQYGPMALAFSGGAASALEIFHRSPLVDVSVDTHSAAYHRESDRQAPYNLFVSVDEVTRSVSNAAGVRDVGFRFVGSDSRVDRAPAATRLSVRSGATLVTFRWDPSARRWIRQVDGHDDIGADGRPVATPNVLIQFCRVTDDVTDIDQAGHPAPYVHTVGTGRAVLFRDRHVLEGRWERGSPADRTRYTDSGGRKLPLRPGGLWVLLVASDSPLKVG